MKKVLFTLVAMVMAISASAQVYVGGSAGIYSKTTTAGGEDVNTTEYKLVPEIGYNIDKDWAVGIAFGWTGETKGNVKTLEVNPYVRYTFIHTKYINTFVDGGVGYGHVYNNENDKDLWSLGFRPGISVNLNEKLSFVAHVGFLGWEQTKDNNSHYKVSKWGVEADGNNLTFGLYYNF